MELGAALKTVKEVYTFREGAFLELDKLAGEPADIIANGVLIAKGEVVVINENFGVRITEITGTSCQSKTQQPSLGTAEPIGRDTVEEPNEDALKESFQEAVQKVFEESK